MLYPSQTAAWTGKRVFITGVCGTVGRELLRILRQLDVAAITGIDINETELFFMREEVENDPRVQLLLCDVRVADVLSRAMRGSDIVLHAAAYKHVEICERSPGEAVFTNIIGTQNVISAAFDSEVERMIFTSSDKAVNPTSVMGTSKLMAERLMTAASLQSGEKGPVFASIRFGNVLGSRGSVVPLFRSQIAGGGPVTLTDPAMTRFMMTISQAAALVMDSVFLARRGEVIVTKMPVMRIEDLARVMVEHLAPRTEVVVKGTKPGEKLYEELTNEEEVRRTFDWGKYLIIKPALLNGSGLFDDWMEEGALLDHPYNSSLETPMTRDEVAAFLQAANELPVKETVCA
jgi:FlaA1/EpsC-like NDP-sugar epimerase